jgi:hypothetical protein
MRGRKGSDLSMNFPSRWLTSRPQRFLVIAVLAPLDLSAALPAALAEEFGKPKIAQEAALTARSLTVARGQAEIRRYLREPGTVIVGDAEVAAASIATSDILVLTGLQPGETNIIVLDDSGAEIDHIALRVVERGTTVVVRRGQERELLRCDPTCNPSDEPVLTAEPSRQIPVPQGAKVPAASESAPAE